MILLKSIPQHIAIFIDEIDSIISLNFRVDEFLFAIKDVLEHQLIIADK